MPKKYLLIVSSFNSDTHLLQPWVTFHHLASALGKGGDDVTIVTDGDIGPGQYYRVVRVAGLRGTNSAELRQLLKRTAFDAALVLVSPFSLATAGWHRLLGRERTIAFISYPLYERKEIFRALKYFRGNDFWQYTKHLLLPKMLWKRKLARCFSKVICQSQRTLGRIGPALGSKNIELPPFVDLNVWRANDGESMPGDRFLYLGGLSPLRGLLVALKAFSLMPESGPRLCILARGASANQVHKLRKTIAGLGLKERAEVIGGWLKPDELKREIGQARAVLFPFVLVPSELPVSVLEVMACGRPVIVSDIDGLPEMAGDGGIVCAAGDEKALAAAILKISGDEGCFRALSAKCRDRMERYPDWGQLTDRFRKILEQ